VFSSLKLPSKKIIELKNSKNEKKHCPAIPNSVAKSSFIIRGKKCVIGMGIFSIKT